LLPLILNIVSAVTSMVTWFGNLNPNIQKLVGIFLLVMAALGPVLLYLSALRDVVRFAGGAFEFLLSPLKLVPAALGLILAPGRAAIGLIGLIGGLFSSSGKESQVGAVRVGASMDEMTAAIAANVATMTGLLAELLTLMGEGIPAAAATAAAAVGGSFADIVGETTVGMTATAEAVNLGMAAILTETETGLVLWNEEFAAAQMRNTVIIQEGFLAQVRVAGEGMAAIEGEVAIGAARTEGGLLAVFTRIPSLIIGIFAGIGPALVGAGEAIVGVLTGPIGIAIAAVVIGFALFRKQIVDGWNAVVGWFKNGAGGLAGAFQPIVNIFDAVVNAAIGAFNSLPLGIRNALQAVVDLVASAVHAVYELFSYLNPWAHHSPSLVENVTTGMDAVQAQFKRLLDVSGPINSAYADIKKFGAEVAALVKSADSIKIRTEVADIKKAGGGTGAVTAYLTETADVARLTAKQTELSAAMKKQQEVLDGLDVGLKKYNADIATQNTLLSQLQQVQAAAQEGMNQASADLQKYQSYGITGQKAMSDAIFQSQMAEKALQLQMMQIEDVTGPMANVQSRMQALQGSMDALRGTSKALRNAGASADITGVYDAQTAAMQTQFDTTRAQVLQYDALQKQLTDVQHKTQELQLQDSLTYDPLTRQINDAASAMKELPFDQILQGVTDSKNALILYTQQYNDATKAVKEQQEVIKGITTARDALQARYDTENAKLDQLKKSYQDVAQAISDVNAELTKLTSSSQAVNSATSAAKGAKGGGATSNFDKNFAAAAGGNFPSAIGKGDLSGGKVGDIAGINAATETSIKNLQDRLKGLNPFKAIQDKWKEFQSWWGTNVTPNLKQFWDNIFGGGGQGAGAGGSMFDGLKSGASALLNFVRPLWTAMKQLWDLFKPDFVKLWKDLKDAFMQIGNDIGPKLVPLFKALMDNFRAWWPIIKIVAEVIGVLLIGAFKVFADILVNVLGPILHGTIALIGDAITIITGVLQVITGVINFTVDLFTGKWGKLRGDMMEILKGVWNIFKGTFEAIYHFLEAIWKTILGNIKGFVNGIVDFFRWLYDILVGHSIIPDMIRAIVKWFTSLPGWVLNAIKGLGSLLWSWAVDAFNWVIRGFTHMWDILTGLLGGLGGKILSALGNVKDLLYNVGSDIVHGLKQGLDDAWHFVTDRFHDLVNLIPGPIKHLLGIASPSRVMAETIGAPIAQGVGVGILEQTPYVMDKMKNLANSVKNYKFIAPVLPAITSLPTAASFAGRATTPAATMTAPASAPVAPTIVSHTDDHSTTVHVESLVLPNIKTPADAQELLDNLEALANGSR
jgi:phage-related protein